MLNIEIFIRFAIFILAVLLDFYAETACIVDDAISPGTDYCYPTIVDLNFDEVELGENDIIMEDVLVSSNTSTAVMN